MLKTTLTSTQLQKQTAQVYEKILKPVQKKFIFYFDRAVSDYICGLLSVAGFTQPLPHHQSLPIAG